MISVWDGILDLGFYSRGEDTTMIALNEFEIIQNTPLAALALWKFCISYYNNTERKYGPSIPIIMVVLPLVFNKMIAKSIYSKHKTGGLYRALSENRDLPVDLQQRMQSMKDQTFRGINFAFAADLIEYDHRNVQIIPKKMTFSFRSDSDEIKQIMSAAERLGYWFSDISLDQISTLLKVRW